MPPFLVGIQHCAVRPAKSWHGLDFLVGQRVVDISLKPEATASIDFIDGPALEETLICHMAESPLTLLIPTRLPVKIKAR